MDKREGTDLEWSCVDVRVTTANACRCCGRSFPGDPERIRNHVRSVHGGGVAGCTLMNGDPRIQELVYESGFVEWDLEMLIEQPDGEPAEPDG